MKDTCRSMTSLFLICSLLIGALFSAPGAAWAQGPAPVLIKESYPEPADPLSTDQASWNALPSGMHAGICSTNHRFERRVVPKIGVKNSWQGTAWRGERLSAQMVFWSKDPITNVSLTLSQFRNDKGEMLSASAATIRFEKYVITDEFAEGCGYRKPEDFAASLAADVLEPTTNYAIKAMETRPVWFTFEIPEEAKPGNYKALLTASIQGQADKTFEFSIKVLPAVLPPAESWKFHLDLWQNPYAVARYHGVTPWSEQHWSLLRPLMKRLADAGQKVITASINKRPWGGQTYDPFDSMIKWTKKKNGKWEYDFQIFDQWVTFMMELGIKNQISCYSMVPWGNEFYFFDEKEGSEVKVKAAPGTKEYEELWKPFLSSFYAHLKDKGWNTITQIAMDERKPEEMKAMIGLLKKYAPEFGIAFADNHKSYKQYPEILQDLSVGFAADIEMQDLESRKSKGQISTHYVCCADPFPNVFTFSEPSEGVFIGWYSIAAGYDGFLRWAYNSWVVSPLTDSRFRTWPAGDTYMVYPDNRSSIRMETLREGIQDAEKIRIIREALQKKGRKKELQKLNDLLGTFVIKEKPKNLEEQVKSGQSYLNQLAEDLF